MKVLRIKIVSNFILLLFFASCTQLHYRRDIANHQSCLEKFRIISQVNKTKKIKDISKIKISGAKSIDQLEEAYGDLGFIKTQWEVSNEHILNHNKLLKDLLKKDFIVRETKQGVKFVDREQASIIYKALSEYSPKYDSECNEMQLGFCFGRATIAHIEALRRGVHPDAIRKIWVVGDMGHWGHHVATMIKSKDSWFVIDTYTGFKEIDKWFELIMKEKKRGANKDLMFFVSQAGRFGPEKADSYNAIDLFGDKKGDFYHGYFKHYFESIDEVEDVELFEQVE